ncbi:MAG: inorganic pyrophosphatase [Cognaticolwellia sp.]|jgi:inorganic pyrophosphatase
MPQPALPQRARILIEVPKGGFVKRELHDDPRIDFISPLPSPYNYGCIPDVPGQDGDPLDVVVLGPRLKAGQTIERDIVGVVRFWDAGKPDDKLIASEVPLTPKQATRLRRFFKIYALARLALNKRKGLSGRTAFVSVITREELDQPWRNGR